MFVMWVQFGNMIILQYGHNEVFAPLLFVDSECQVANVRIVAALK
jgi:hypothetical protein